MINVTDAQQIIRDNIQSLDVETINIQESQNRILAKNIFAKTSHPITDVSAMDGYALCINTENPTSYYDIVGTSAAGESIDLKLEHNQCVKIYTGGQLPNGANTILIQENSVFKDGRLFVKNFEINKHIRKEGQDFRIGDLILKKQKNITYRDIGLMALDDRNTIPVYKKPKISILSTGDEITFPGEEKKKGQFSSANGPALASFVRERRGLILSNKIEPDSLSKIIKSITNMKDSDLIITTGGASVGDKDFIKKALKELGVKTFFEKVLIKPGKPIIFGLYEDTPIFCLPGNPVSALVCATIFVNIALDKLSGLPGLSPLLSKARLIGDISDNGPRETYLRAKLEIEKNSQLSIKPFKNQDSNMILNFAKANALIMRKPYEKSSKNGDLVDFIDL
tara:strand:+ start:140 stop:1327 length:1188 start_codon:yes stop_codon:yes gene_type:complete